MFKNDPKKKAIAWFVVLVFFSIVFTVIAQIIQMLEIQGVDVYPEVPQLVSLGIFLLVGVVFYFLPLLRTHHYAREATIKWLTVLSKVLIIHFYCVLGIAAIFIIVFLFRSF